MRTPGWVVVGIMWLFFSAFCVGLFPLWQGRKTAAHTIKYMFLDATGKRRPQLESLQGESQTPPVREGEDGVEEVAEMAKKE